VRKVLRKAFPLSELADRPVDSTLAIRLLQHLPAEIKHRGELTMDHNKEHDTDKEHNKEHDPGKEHQKEKDPGTGYNKGKDPGTEHLKNNTPKDTGKH
jgi:hypothetical protein